MAKPATVPVWDTNLTDVTAPPLAQQTDGVDPADEVELPAEWLNYFWGWGTQWYQYLDGIEAEALEWGPRQWFKGGIEVGDTSPTLWFMSLFSLFSTTAGFSSDFMGNGQRCIVVNAVYDDDAAYWTCNKSASPALRILITNGSGAPAADAVAVQYHAATGGTWAEGAWTDLFRLSYSDVAAIRGGLNVSGPIAAQSGDVEAQSGNVKATDGNVEATGTPAGSAGPGLVKAGRFYATGTPVVNTDFVPGGGWGATASVTGPRGTDTAGEVGISEAGGGYSANPYVRFTFKEGTFTSAPIVMATHLRNTDYPTPVSINVDVTATYVDFRPAITPSGGKTFAFQWHIIGV